MNLTRETLTLKLNEGLMRRLGQAASAAMRVPEKKEKLKVGKKLTFWQRLKPALRHAFPRSD